ncbi:MAG: type I methionyl aminopeptidase [Candidatus Spechtbacterales bacterium]
MDISIKSHEDIEQMRQSGKIAALILNEVAQEAKPGVTTEFLNELAERLCKNHDVKPAFKGYTGFPAALCTSNNDVIVHGIPNNQPLKDGDVLGLDFGVIYHGWYSDTAVTVGVGDISFESRHLLSVAKKALRLGIKKAKPGNTVGDIGNTVQRFVEKEGFSIVKELVGHGVGKDLHEEPQIPNYGKRGKGEKLREGMVIAIEPMIIEGSPDIALDSDKFSYKSADGSYAAHFEHTIAITEKGPEVLTKI